MTLCNYKHGDTGTKFYQVWKNVRRRCNNIKSKDYHRWGGRGITYDLKWNNYLNFKKDMYFKYLYAIKQLKIKKPSIERINNNGNYCFDNCIFIELKDQNKNTRKNKWFKAISPERKIILSKNQSEFCKKYNLNKQKVNGCLKNRYGYKSVKGWTFKYLAPTGGGVD